MANLLIFWGENEQSTLTWKLNQTETKTTSEGDVNSDSYSNASYQLQSEEILKADLNCLADMAEKNKVSLILSSQDIISAELDIPNRNPKLIRKAIPFMMEDEVATAVDSLFYAYKERGKDKPISVRGIERSYIESLIEQFAKAEIKLEHILLEQDLITTPKDGYSVLLEESNCAVVNTEGDIWNCFPEDFSWLIQKQLAESENSQMASNQAENNESLAIAISLNIYSTLNCAEFVKNLPVGRFAVKEHSIESKQSLLAKSFSNVNMINLMQEEYEPKKEKSNIGIFVSKIASIAAALFVTFIVFQSVKIFTLSEQKEQLDARKMTMYKQAFPSRKTPSSPARALKNMRDYMRSIGASSESSGFLKLLDTSSNSLTDLNKVYPTNISYDIARNELRLDLIASSLVELDKFADALKSSGHKVERSSETQRGEGFSSRLTIRN